MARVATLLRIVSIAVLMASNVDASVIWEDGKEQESVTLGAGAAVEMGFRFRNAGPMPISIAAVRPSCGCTAYDLEKTTYIPGEEGVLTLTTDLRNRSGTLHNLVDIYYEDTVAHVDTLRWTINITDPVLMVPDSVVWKIGERSETRTVGMARAGDAAIVVSAVELLGDSFTFRLVTVADSDVYEIRISPRDTGVAARGVMRVLAGVTGATTWRTVGLRIE